MEDYAAKMAGKTDTELRRYIEHRVEYIEAAVLAAPAELERRGHTVLGAPALRTELETAVQSAVPAAPVVPPWARPVEEVEEAEVPVLYSRGSIALFSVVFSYVIGAILLLLNLLRLQRYGGAALLMAVVASLISAQAYLPALLNVNPYYATVGINLGAALIYLFAIWPYFIGSQPYQPRSWLVPFLIFFGVSLLVVLRMASTGGLPVIP